MKTTRISFWTVFFCALAACSFFVLVVPLQTFLANGDFFTYSLATLIKELLVIWSIALVALFLLLTCIRCLSSIGWLLWVPNVVLAFIFSAVMCGYVETVFLSAWLPPLDGDMLCFMNAYLKVVDTLVLGGVFIASGCMMLIFRRHANWMFAIILIMVVASLFDVKIKRSIRAGGPLSGGFCSKLAVAKSMVYSTNRNVLVFILDSLPATVVSDVLASHPELAGKFKGFVSYRKNIGMHECTHRGLPGLMTGRYAGDGDTINSYSTAIFGPDSFLMPYVQAGYPTCFIGQMFEFGYTNQKHEELQMEPSADKTGMIIYRRCGSVPNLSLWEVVCFRLSPFARKLSVLSSAIEKGRQVFSVSKETELYPILARAKEIETPVSLGVFHTFGVHVPLSHDWDGTLFKSDVPEPARLNGAAYYALNKLGNLFEVLNDRGIYDRSTIIVMADHGIIFNEHPEGEMGQASAALMVKPEHSQIGFMTSEIPTSHCKVAELMKQVCCRSLQQKEVELVLRKDFRLYRGRFKKSLMFYDWTYGPSGELVERKEAGVFKGQ